MIVHLTDEAVRNLENIGDYIAQDSPTRALTFVRELREKCLSLADRPLAFPLVPHYETHGIRRRVHGNHLIFYRTEADRVVVLHVLHGAMDYAAILFQDEI
ncbi:type II toxin-antitoxin system RelE/ParE family toxin [Alcaligenes sp. NLF5-7]|uniref:type II toxin-antitoxin system RelE/ParE family toxin n=1 Tax=Alcaligenes sp. NLF5-7 TaxID=2918755 RepID=UPI0020C25C0F|nr:type II toxin-antitoxin system RelE/ParE family toxin [Alcaligenes sp. NLF5-7]UTM01069.1 type II toxin-antitoxin system RelE/ParE family toxin [Alcaligenes sp. NLF5-7]